MNWLVEMPDVQPVAWAVLVIALVGVAGLALASVQVLGVRLGIAGVLFAGIVGGHLGLRVQPAILDFVREFGLILFVFTIGLQLGPGFFASLRKQALKLNLLAASVVLLGVGMTWLVAHALLRVNLVAALGLFSGGTTNTPSLGAAQQTLRLLGPPLADQAGLPALAYAVAYPGGVYGVISVLMLLRWIFRINPEREAEIYRAEQRRGGSSRSSA